jgi:lipopolysaccharide transport system permease protein
MNPEVGLNRPEPQQVQQPEIGEADEDFDVIIEPGRAVRTYWQDLWRYRELFGFLAWRDILVRYKQTGIGIAWSVIRPLLTMLIFTVVFGRLAHLASPNAPYPILVFAAMLPWQFFANALGESSSSLVDNGNLLSKVYFPRLIVPAGSVIVSLIDFCISFVLLLGLMIWFRHVPTVRIVALPIFLMMAVLSAFGGGMLFSALNVKYRDFRYVIPFVLQLGIYVSPVGFSSDIVPERWRLLYALNPMVGVIDGFRWAIIGSALEWQTVAVSAGAALGLCIGGLYYFRSVERRFADVI